MTAKRWANQDAYAAAIEAAADLAGVPIAIAYGLIAQESGFNANAIRQEPSYHCAQNGKTGDASYGLMQVLYCTALGLGYTGTPTGLFDVDANLSLGMQLLGGLLSRYSTEAALSAYNGGYRPSLGYGAARVDGTFANQKYVDNILNNAAYFTDYLAERDGADHDGVDYPVQQSIDDPQTVDETGRNPLAIAVGVIGGSALAYAIVRALTK